ncbi:hypothetical protein ACFY4C_37340 [Actinomadura viridis]|uniref:hypothetical protein n=1 Tax=Actinomadura viridis TaxID=58110 RepID=UPI0036BCBF6D
MGKGTRTRHQRADQLSVVFCDLDFDRASRPFGRGTAPAPPEGWAVARAGLVYAAWNGHRLQVTGDELIDGPHTASRLIAALRGKRLVVGHGLLSCDLRAVAMVTGVPDTVVRRSVDTLALAHRLRGTRYPTGCNLSDLAWENLGVRRTKPHFPDRLGEPAQRGDSDPREDALLVSRLWQSMLTEKTLSWGTGMSISTHQGSTVLTAQHLAELTGRTPQPEAHHWRDLHRFKGLTAADLPAPTLIREVADQLRRADLIPDRRLSEEELFTACQWLGVHQNYEVRDRMASGRRLTKQLRQRLGQALWESMHVPYMIDVMRTRQLSKTSVHAYRKSRQDMEYQARIRAQIAAALRDQASP